MQNYSLEKANLLKEKLQVSSQIEKLKLDMTMIVHQLIGKMIEEEELQLKTKNLEIGIKEDIVVGQEEFQFSSREVQEQLDSLELKKLENINNSKRNINDLNIYEISMLTKINLMNKDNILEKIKKEDQKRLLKIKQKTD